MKTPRQQLLELIEQGAIAPEHIGPALKASRVAPSAREWQRFVAHSLLGIGAVAVGLSVIFFIAYNWGDLGRLFKFALVEAVLVAAIAGYGFCSRHQHLGQLSLLLATLVLGALLALFGQTYQTGADPWQLFFNWALLMLPWTLLSRFAVLWLLWLALLNLSLILYYQTFGGFFGLILISQVPMLWLVFGFNTLALLLWEMLSGRYPWLAERWCTRLIAVAAGTALTLLCLHAIVDTCPGPLPAIAWLGWSGVLYYLYRSVWPDLFMLAGLCLAGIVIITSFVAHILPDDLAAASFLMLALLVIGLGTGAALWLKRINQEWQ